MNTFNCLLVFEVTDHCNGHSFMDEHLLLIQAINNEAAKEEALAYAESESGSIYTDQDHHMEWQFAGIKRLLPLSTTNRVQCLETRENFYSAEYVRGLRSAEPLRLTAERF